ncbi:DUF6903 family protein [Clostridium sp.]
MNKIKILSMVILCVIAVFLVIKGQILQGYYGLSMMLVGVLILLVELFIYNRKYV